ncbi:hypothetical protein JHK84_028159 [Glycine max]|nr:hypothetical protein JHK86_028038 [Glycine max]KAG5151687.1 hypothetical protein JHK84_028159 [Glycine max]
MGQNQAFLCHQTPMQNQKVGDLRGDLKQGSSALEMAGVFSSDGGDLWTVLVQLGDILDQGCSSYDFPLTLWVEEPVSIKENLHFHYTKAHPTTMFSFNGVRSLKGHLKKEHISVLVGHSFFASLVLMMP